MQGISPLGDLFPTVKAQMDGTTYCGAIDSMMSAMLREAGRFSPMFWPSAFGTSMTMFIAPGSYYSGTSVVEVGAWTTGTTSSGSGSVSSIANTTGVSAGMLCVAFTYATISTSGTMNGTTTATVTSATGMAIGMAIYGTNIAPGTVINNIVGTTLTLSIAATGSGTNTVNVIGMQPLVPLGTTVTGVSTSSVTLSNNATGSVTGAYLCFANPIGCTISCVKHGTTSLTGIASTAGIFVGMAVAGTGISGGTTVAAVPSSSTITLSAAATDSLTSNLTFSIPAPGSNTRIDMVSINEATGSFQYNQGIASATPTPPSLPGNSLPVALISTTSATTTIAAANVSDIRILGALGAGNLFVPFSGTGASYISGTLRLFQNSTDTPGLGNTVTGGAWQQGADGGTFFLSKDEPGGGTTMCINNNSLSAGSAIALELNYQGAAVGSITITASSTVFNTTSDYRLKDILSSFEDAWKAMAGVPVYLGAWKSEPDEPMPMILAHEVQNFTPEIVTGEKDDVWGEDGPRDKEGSLLYPVGTIKAQQVDFSKLGPRIFSMAAALEKALARIEVLEAAAKGKS